MPWRWRISALPSTASATSRICWDFHAAVVSPAHFAVGPANRRPIGERAVRRAHRESAKRHRDALADAAQQFVGYGLCPYRNLLNRQSAAPQDDLIAQPRRLRKVRDIYPDHVHRHAAGERRAFAVDQYG